MAATRCLLASCEVNLADDVKELFGSLASTNYQSEDLILSDAVASLVLISPLIEQCLILYIIPHPSTFCMSICMSNEAYRRIDSGMAMSSASTAIWVLTRLDSVSHHCTRRGKASLERRLVVKDHRHVSSGIVEYESTCNLVDDDNFKVMLLPPMSTPKQFFPGVKCNLITDPLDERIL